MDTPLSGEQWELLKSEGFLRIPGAFASSFDELEAAARGLCKRFPYGFGDPRYYTGHKPVPLTAATARQDRRILIPYAGFLDTRILRVLNNARLHEMLERIVGKDFYLSNTWYQEVPPGAQRLSYHKDTRGSISFNILLDEIETGMGSTCLVPGSHLNTPPARYCMSDIHAPHPKEIDLTGKPGDCILFSTETWHARSKNTSNRNTRRLFYNFYSRSSRNTTTWAGIVDPQQIEELRDSFPVEFRHMFDIDAERTARLANVNGSVARKKAFEKSTSDLLVRDFAYSAFAYGQTADNPAEPGALMPFTTRLTEADKFRPIKYLSYLRPIPTLKNIYSFLRSKLRALATPAPSSTPAAVRAQ